MQAGFRTGAASFGDFVNSGGTAEMSIFRPEQIAQGVFLFGGDRDDISLLRKKHKNPLNLNEI